MSFLQSNSYFLIGIATCCRSYFTNGEISKPNIGFGDIKNYIPWIRGILNKHVRTFVSLQISIKIYNLFLTINT